MWTVGCKACMWYAQTHAPAGVAASPAEHREIVLLGQRSSESGRIWCVVVAVGQLARNRLGGCIGTHVYAHSLKLKELQEVHLSPRKVGAVEGQEASSIPVGVVGRGTEADFFLCNTPCHNAEMISSTDMAMQQHPSCSPP